VIVRVPRDEDVDEFCSFLTAVGVRATAGPHGFITVRVPAAVTIEQEKRELEGYVSTWNALKDDAPVEVIS
jgi:hypothetical protein